MRKNVIVIFMSNSLALKQLMSEPPLISHNELLREYKHYLPEQFGTGNFV
jgi:hypothetical protein